MAGSSASKHHLVYHWCPHICVVVPRAPSYPDFTVGLLCGPLPWAEVIDLGELDFLVIEAVPGYFYLRPYPWPSLPGHMAYVQGDDPSELHPMYPSSGREDCAVFGVNTGPLDCDGQTIQARPRSWGLVKSLYH